MNGEPNYEQEYIELIERLGEAYVRHRLTAQTERMLASSTRASALPYLANGGWKRLLIHYGLKATGLYERGYRNFLDVQIRHNHISIAHLPDQFDGFCVLQLSDLHIDMDRRLTTVILERVADLSFDVAVITGDFRNGTVGPTEETIDRSRQIADGLDGPVYGILGNHDFLDMVPALERTGIRILLNETIRFRRGQSSLYMTGIDDHHFYATDDLPAAAADVPENAASILLSHTPDIYRAAAAHRYDLMLSGHTHAGQICLPGGRIIQRNARCPLYMHRGAWRYSTLQGYTSAGTGATGVPIRFFCPPEITLHTLHKPQRTTLHSTPMWPAGAESRVENST